MGSHYRTNYISITRRHTLIYQVGFNIKGGGAYKARLVARGDLQSETTYTETYSPTLRQKLRTIMS